MQAGEDAELKGLLGLPEDGDRHAWIQSLFAAVGSQRGVGECVDTKGASFFSLRNVSSSQLQTCLGKKNCISWDLKKLKIDSCGFINNS